MAAMEHPKTICVDFDGVIHRYDSGWQGADVICDPPVDGAFKALHNLCDDPEIEVAIHSSRSAGKGGIEAMKKWLDYHENLWRISPAPEHENIINPYAPYLSERCTFPTDKPPAMVYIDDRGINFDGDWSKITPDLKDYTPWNKKEETDK